MLAMMPFRLLCLSSSPLHISIKPMTCWNGMMTFAVENCRLPLCTSLEIPFSEPDPFALAWSFEGAITHVWNTVCTWILLLPCVCVRGFGGVYALYLPSVGIGVFSMTCELKKRQQRLFNRLIDPAVDTTSLYNQRQKYSYSMTSTTNPTSKISRI